ncbi:MAG: NAD-glutamate dehydrogenase [Alphaproteobacteria bacterium]|nr:NAD-glutamate dehydrogenase [Alphaproteobacteria bacterium]
MARATKQPARAKAAKNKQPNQPAKQDANFAKLLFAKAAPEDIASLSPETRATIAGSLHQFIQTRKPNKPKLRIYAPNEKQHGWTSRHMVLEVSNDDMPFLVDSITGELNRHGLTVHMVVHPLLQIIRDGEGKLDRILNTEELDPSARIESCMHIRFDKCDKKLAAQLAKDIENVLSDVRAVVQGWQKMLGKISDAIVELSAVPESDYPSDDIHETRAFLHWLTENNYTFLGYREIKVRRGEHPRYDIISGSGLGVLRNDKVLAFDRLAAGAKLSPGVHQFMRKQRLLLVLKTNRRSTVHRTVPMDAIFVPRYNKDGKIVGERLFVGLFTSTSLTRTPREIPVLRRKIANVMQNSGFAMNSHDGKALIHTLNTYPRDELFQISEKELERNALGILHLQERQRAALFARHDPFERFVTCLVYVPRDRYDTTLREKITATLEKAYNGKVYTYNTRLDDSKLARVFVIISTMPGSVGQTTGEEIEAELQRICHAWTDRLRDALINIFGESRGIALHQRYGKAFPRDYCDATPPEIALHDIAELEHLDQERTFSASLSRRAGAPENVLFLKLFSSKGPIALSDAVPIIENMGLLVKNEGGPYVITPAHHDNPVWVHDFAATAENDRPIDLQVTKNLFEEAFTKVWKNQADDDGFNRLVLLAGFNWLQVTLIRTLAHYLQQIRTPHSLPAISRTLRKHTLCARLIVDMFEARHNPGQQKNAAKIMERIETEANALLGGIPILDEDRIIRRMFNLVRASLRTNYFQTDDAGNPKPCLAIKFDSMMIDNMPLPRPLIEIFVHGREVEAIHLRRGKVARGGLRWSEREDFRNETLGLMKAQVVKNSVIVPLGAKGSFVVRHPRAEKAREHGIECYKMFIRSMLDITDNQVKGKIVPPRNVVCHDGDDPYLVVAADKGTATFSDIANGVAAEYGFWLDDAFASGGSVGYDHKKMGITARGAWEAVKRHFREIGTDIQKQPFTCAGVGDMSGDVFGNGMLLSKFTRLVGAFDHRHIFCDPNPDHETSFEERKRLFNKPGSSWADYNAKLISKGGGVFARSEKNIKVTPEIKAAFDIQQDVVTPGELMQAILKMRVDLLYFGGIGTYIKASHESNDHVGDRVNEAIRIDGRDVRAKVIAEGANLAITQYGRIEFGLNEGRINTDAIDNSAGVDTSDHEVNIKIALSKPVSMGKLSFKQRNNFLKSMTDEVARLVLRDNYLQTQAITLAQSRGVEMTGQLAHMMRYMEKTGMLDRTVEQLPDDEEISARMQAHKGFTRPELAVLLSYAKIWLYRQLLPSALPEDPFLESDLVTYFPVPMQKRYRDAIMHHQLRREIIATVATNSFINRAGMHTVFKVMNKTGREPADISMAYLLTRDTFELREIWEKIEALDNKVPAEAQANMMIHVHKVISYCMPWFLRRYPGKMALHKLIPHYRKGARELKKWITTMMPRELVYEVHNVFMARLVEQNVPKELARHIAYMPLLTVAPDIVELSDRLKLPIAIVAEVYYRIDQKFGFTWLRDRASMLSQDTHLHREAVNTLVIELYTTQHAITTACLASEKPGRNAALHLNRWLGGLGSRLEAVDQLLAELNALPAMDFQGISLAVTQLAALPEK